MYSSDAERCKGLDPARARDRDYKKEKSLEPKSGPEVLAGPIRVQLQPRGRGGARQAGADRGKSPGEEVAGGGDRRS